MSKKEELIPERDILVKLFTIILEIDARTTSNNCVNMELLDKSFIQLCDDAIEILKKLKED